jgi:hypothetical protein
VGIFNWENMMKNLMTTLALTVLTSTAFAGTNATLVLSGSVPKKLDISLDTNAVVLDLTTSKNLVKIATVTEKSNSNTGYKVTIASANKGVLKRVGGTETFAYTLKYGSTPLTAQGVTAGDTIVGSSSAGLTNVNKDLAISYSGVAAESMVEGSYEDTINLTIAAN